MRALPLCLAVAAIGCASPPAPESTCGHVKTARPVIVLERGDQTSALARLADGCLEEAPADFVLGHDQNLLGAGSRVFIGLNEEAVLRELDVSKLELGATFDVYGMIDKPAPIHGIYGAAVDAEGKLWASLSDAGSLAIMRPDGSPEALVDLSDLDQDRVPDMNGVLVRDGRAYIALGFLPTDEISDHAKHAGAIAVVDVATRARLSVIELAGKNPVHALVPAEEGQVLVATPGEHDAVDDTDGIDRVWLDGSRETEQVVGEGELDGSVEEIAWGGPNELYAIVLGREPGLNPTRVVAIDPSRDRGARVTRVLAEAPYFGDPVNGAAYVHVGLALTEEHVLVGDKTPGAGRIRVFSRATGEELGPIPTRVHPPAALYALP